MLTLHSPQVCQQTISHWKREGHKVILVPTMGCLHQGHLELIQKARKCGTRTIVSIFVNPLQFGPNEDFGRYPRTLQNDISLLEAAHVDMLFLPSLSDLYPEGFQNRVVTGKLSQSLCGENRPGHFDGVATVCLKLFNTTLCDAAVFGEKDFQQIRVIEQLVNDFNLPIAIIRHPIIRETNGLALSSRNRYLSEKEAIVAPLIFKILNDIQNSATNNSEQTIDELERMAKINLIEAGFSIDYVTIVSSRSLEKTSPTETCIKDISLPRIFIAVKLGQTRLIDNLLLLQRDCTP